VSAALRRDLLQLVVGVGEGQKLTPAFCGFNVPAVVEADRLHVRDSAIQKEQINSASRAAKGGTVQG
jgi:hypothetical protein